MPISLSLWMVVGWYYMAFVARRRRFLRRASSRCKRKVLVSVVDSYRDIRMCNEYKNEVCLQFVWLFYSCRRRRRRRRVARRASSSAASCPSRAAFRFVLRVLRRGINRR
jgi:hypothetical protein